MEQIQAGTRQGKLSPDMMVCAEGSSEWQPVTSLPGVAFPQAAAPASAPRPPQAPPAAPAANYHAAAPQFGAPAQHAAMGGAAQRGPQLPTFAPFAAWSWVICCFGWVWGIIVWFQLCNAINAASGTTRCQGISIIVPIWWAIHFGDVCTTINEIIAAHGLPVQPIQNNIALNILLPSLPFQNLISTWNQIAAAVNGR